MHGQLENRTISIFVLDRIILDNLTYLEFSAEEFRIFFEYSEYSGIIHLPSSTIPVDWMWLSVIWPPLLQALEDTSAAILRYDHHCPFVNNCLQLRSPRTGWWKSDHLLANVDPRVQELGYPKIKSFTVTPHVLLNGHDVKCGLINPYDKTRRGTPNKQGVYDSWGNILAFLTHKRSIELPAFRALWCCPRCWPAQLSLFLWLRHIGRLRKGYGLTTWFQKRYGMDQRHSMFPMIFRGIDIHFPEQGFTRVPGFLLLPRYWCSHSRLQQPWIPTRDIWWLLIFVGATHQGDQSSLWEPSICGVGSFYGDLQ